MGLLGIHVLPSGPWILLGEGTTKEITYLSQENGKASGLQGLLIIEKSSLNWNENGRNWKERPGGEMDMVSLPSWRV